jgi:spermidine synthase
MDIVFEELDFQETPLGEISLRKRTEPRLDNVLIYEVKLGDEFLMSSLFVEAEEQLSILALENLRKRGIAKDLSVVVGGLGLGYTALIALNDPAVESLEVIDVMQPVIDWHKRGLLPIGDVLATNPKCTLRLDDFFAVAGAETPGFGRNHQVDAVLLDIDHSPSHWLNDANSRFYSVESLHKLANKIKPNGIFGLWSNELPDPDFSARLEQVFSIVEAHEVWFPNPYSGGESSNSVYLAIKS